VSRRQAASAGDGVHCGPVAAAPLRAKTVPGRRSAFLCACRVRNLGGVHRSRRRPGEKKLSLISRWSPWHYAEALNQLGAWLGDRAALDVIREARGSADRFARSLASGMPFFDDPGFWKRAQITANDLALAGVASFADIDRLTVFADILVPHVLRVDGVLRYHPELAARVDAGCPLAPGSPMEREIRACAVHACELLAGRLGVPPRILDNWLWNRGQAPPYNERPAHRTHTVFY
jgi:Potential Queuosine, Q, salvage protein family